eukprot:SAG11_NODE_30321_length_295_cov_0.625616_1_plen_76_part_01
MLVAHHHACSFDASKCLVGVGDGMLVADPMHESSGGCWLSRPSVVRWCGHIMIGHLGISVAFVTVAHRPGSVPPPS